MLNAICQCLGFRRKESPRPQISAPLPGLRPLSLQPAARPAPRPPDLQTFKLSDIGSMHNLRESISQAMDARGHGRLTPLQIPRRPLSDLPQSVSSIDVPRLSYADKGKGRANVVPPPEPVHVPTHEEIQDDEELSSGSSHYSSYYG